MQPFPQPFPICAIVPNYRLRGVPKRTQSQFMADITSA